MKRENILRAASLFGLVLAVGIMAFGCSKKEEEPPPPPPTPAEATPQQPAAAAPTYNPAPAAQMQDSRAAMEAANAALRAREYEQAVQTMLQLQRQAQLNEQQAQAVRNNMVKLQGDLAAAVASGDPKAKAAAEMLRRSAMR